MNTPPTSKNHLPKPLGLLILAIACLVAGCNEDKPKITIVLPQDEANFIRIVSSAQSDAKSAQNDMQVGGVKAKRDRALCDSGLSYVVNDWVGKLERIDSNSDGKGVLSVSIAPDILVKTWNNDLSDLMDGTLIAPGTALFEAASAMQRGQYVTFSGLLYRGSDGDCVKEASLTLKGKVTEPEFIFKFDKIAQYVPGAPKAPVAALPMPAQAAVEAVVPAIPAAPAPGPTSKPPEQTTTPVTEPAQPSTTIEPVRATGPSFDCAKAGSVIEQLICKDEALARLDVQLAQAYKAAVQQTPDKSQLKSEQLSWLKNRRNKCATAECVFAAYEERLTALRN